MDHQLLLLLLLRRSVVVIPTSTMTLVQGRFAHLHCFLG